MKSVIEGEIDDYKSLAETLRRRLKYLTDDLKTALCRMKEQGIEIGKARKGEQKKIEEAIASESRLSTQMIDYKNFFVARRGKEIVATASIVTHDGGILELRLVWVANTARGQRLGQLLARTALSKVKKGKVYIIIDQHLEEYYAEIGFRHVITPPELLLQKEQEFQRVHPEHPLGLFFVYEAGKQKPDTSFSERPDLLLIDGGKGQLSAVVDVLRELHLDIPVAGLAKREEEIFIPGQSVPLLVKEGSEPRFLLQRLRDEAHRFANDRRQRRLTSALFASKLDEVPGIGEETKKVLLKKFGSADAVLSAKDEALREVLNEVQLQALKGKYL